MGRGAVAERAEAYGATTMLIYGKGETLRLGDSEGLGRGEKGIRIWRAIMDFTAEKKDSENNSANNPKNAHQTLDSSSELMSTLDSSSKETEKQQSHELKAGLHPLKVRVWGVYCILPSHTHHMHIMSETLYPGLSAT
ncbi:hypothetical protein LR48_Vigan727s000100 [Vigna angularis]|uniref:Uncharacterized protein n=1 Tax=Phaseolus angularis TaxID=3914 RepID=A0A0L9TGH0_PHAAN|nr:hypothetical protein LR48_Vigan727s000100 [Vigna angularis]